MTAMAEIMILNSKQQGTKLFSNVSIEWTPGIMCHFN